MARPQTRRSVSVKGTTYDRILLYLKQTGKTSIAGYVEERIAEKLGPPSAEELQKFEEQVQSRQDAAHGPSQDQQDQPLVADKAEANPELLVTEPPSSRRPKLLQPKPEPRPQDEPEPEPEEFAGYIPPNLLL